MLAGPANDSLKARTVFFATQPLLLSHVGPQDPSTTHEAGLSMLRPGFTKVWVDSAGPKMKQVHFLFDKQVSWKQCLSSLGLDGSHGAARPQSVAASPVPLLRSKESVSGVKGLPAGSWGVTYIEYAIANKDRLRQLKKQIQAAGVGEQRLKLIRSCYDWKSELDFSKS